MIGNEDAERRPNAPPEMLKNEIKEEEARKNQTKIDERILWHAVVFADLSSA